MKNIIKLTILLLPLLSCTKEPDAETPAETVKNYAGIAGTWQLTEWLGEPMPEGLYCYMVIERAADEETGNRTLTIYQNIDSSKSHCITATYMLVEEEDGDVYITGSYDFGGGLWNEDYLISSLTQTQMTWIMAGNDSDVSVYTRCDAVPEDITTGVRSH